ncbi:hypothetical protein vseg_002200 [Gypsophila vaccaria]
MDDGEKSPPKQPLHPVYTVTNIQHKVRVLDGVKVSYATWVSLFTLHARGYKVLNHIDDTPAPTKTDPSYAAWCEIDAHVLQWIYGTLSDDLLPRVLEPNSTAQAAWNRVKNIFLNNKGARAASLESEFHSLKLGNFPSFDAYCQRLRELSGQLKDVDAEVTYQRLVLQLVRGLPKEYDTVAAYINQTMPTFETARSMIELENHRQSSREDNSAMVASSTNPRFGDDTQPPTHNHKRSHGGSNGGKRGHSKGSYNGGGSRSQSQRSPSTRSSPKSSPWGPTPFWPTPWTPPPCPYPTFPGWTTPWQPWTATAPPSASRSTSARGSTHPSSSQHGQAHLASDAPQPQPTDLAQAFAALHPPSFNSGPFYMDTGASSHLSADAGFSEWESDSEEQ